jgi:hypothetical protein
MADNPVLELLLRRLEVADGGLDSAELATQLGVEHQAVVGAVKSLQALGEVSPGVPRLGLAFIPAAPLFLVKGHYVLVHRGVRWWEVWNSFRFSSD